MKRVEQRGAALLLALLMLILGSLHFLFAAAGGRADRLPSRKAAAAHLDRVREAIVGHALETGCLPCPANSVRDGIAPAACDTAASRFGFVPWRTLGVPAADPWGGAVRYRVSAAYASVSCTFGAASTGDAEIRTRDPGGAVRVLESGAPFVLLSHGPNRLGAVLASGRTTAPPPAAHQDERTNRFDRDRFVSRPWSEDPAAPGGPFDDLLAWMAPETLCRRLATRKGWSCP